MTTQAEWLLADDGRELLLKVDGCTFATITRWSDKKTKEHCYWGVERHDGYSLGIVEHLVAACRRATAAAGVDLPPPQDLVADWPPEKQPEPSSAVPDTDSTAVPATRALYGRCACSHVWPVVYLPMPLDQAATVMKRASCPKCGSIKGIKIATEGEVAARC